MNEKNKSTRIIIPKIALALFFIGLGAYSISHREFNQESASQLNKINVERENQVKELNNLHEKIKTKEQLTNQKIAILKQVEAILSNPSNQWSVIFSSRFQDFRTIDLYGNAKSKEAKEHVLSLISQIPEVYVIRENIIISPEMNFHNEKPPLQTYDNKKDIIRSDVAVISMTEEEFLKLQNTTKSSLDDEEAINEKIKKKIEDNFFNNPSLYDDISDIKVSVTERVPEIKGTLSSESNKDQINTILDKMKKNGEILTYINKTKSYDTKLAKLHSQEIKDSYSNLKSMIFKEYSDKDRKEPVLNSALTELDNIVTSILEEQMKIETDNQNLENNKKSQQQIDKLTNDALLKIDSIVKIHEEKLKANYKK